MAKLVLKPIWWLTEPLSGLPPSRAIRNRFRSSKMTKSTALHDL
jgi:hypothetical protein